MKMFWKLVKTWRFEHHEFGGYLLSKHSVICDKLERF